MSTLRWVVELAVNSTVERKSDWVVGRSDEEREAPADATEALSAGSIMEDAP